jgi:hypothetical protein
MSYEQNQSIRNKNNEEFLSDIYKHIDYINSIIDNELTDTDVISCEH